MSWHFSQALEAASSAANSSAGAPSAPSKSTTTPAACSSLGRTTDASPPSQSGTTSEPSTAARGVEWWISSLADSRAKTSAQLGAEPASTALAPVCGPKWPESFARWDRDTCSWRTPQCSLLAGLDEYSETWPRWGIMRGGECSALTPPALRMNDSESGSSQRWPTSCAQDAKNSTLPPSQLNRNSVVGAVMRRRVPTPTATDARRGVESQQARLDRGAHTGTTLNDYFDATGGVLNPCLHQWLMGWPIGWTNYAAPATDRFRQWCASHGITSHQMNNQPTPLTRPNK